MARSSQTMAARGRGEAILELRGALRSDGREARRTTKAIDIVCRLTSARRTTHLSIPAGDLLHAEPCGDEDMYLCDTLNDLRTRLAAAEGLLKEALPRIVIAGTVGFDDAMDAARDLYNRVTAHLTPAPEPVDKPCHYSEVDGILGHTTTPAPEGSAAP